MDLRTIAQQANANSREKGFWDDEPERGTPEHRLYMGNKCMLTVGEVAEAHEEIRKGHDYDHRYYSDQGGILPKPEGFLSEKADIIIRELEVTEHLGLTDELILAIIEKMAYNASRGHMHGKKF